MFNVVLDYPSYEQEAQIVKQTTSNNTLELSTVMTSKEILKISELIRKIPL